MKNKVIGLRQRMAQATSKDELQTLAAEARTYQYASHHTLRRWFNTIRKRSKQLAAVLMLLAVVGCAPSGTPSSQTVGTVNGNWVEEVEIKGHNYLVYGRSGLIHAEHCKCKTQ